MLVACLGVTVNRSCFAFCRRGYIGDAVAEWTCRESGGTPLSDPVDGFALYGDVPHCVAQICNLTHLECSHPLRYIQHSKRQRAFSRL